jgi:hypothetical protein
MPYNKITIAAGVLSGFGAMVWTLFEYAMGWHTVHFETGAVTGFVAIIFPIAATIWALNATRASQQGWLTLFQAMKCGFAVSTINALIGVAFFAVYYSLINPGFLVEMRARGHEVDLTSQLLVVALGSMVFGLLVAVVAGFFMRTRGEATE